MDDNELLLIDRLDVIKKTIEKYGENNFYISFSGGKDSTVVSHLIDMALPNNKIPRVFSNTGIEYKAIVDFVKEQAEKDERFVIITPNKNIKQMLEENGYPFKSKDHSLKVHLYQIGSNSKSLNNYINGFENIKYSRFQCPERLKYQFSNDFQIKISDRCCYELKKHPFKLWQKENGKKITITGMRKDEKGQRGQLKCIVTSNNEVVKFHPLAVVNDEWENWFIEKYHIELSKLYYPPYNFTRTGCKGCPYTLTLQKQLDVMEQLLPNEKKQCEVIWKPIYDEYRRIGYRLKPLKDKQLTIDDFI